jgi:hypothetical protein
VNEVVTKSQEPEHKTNKTFVATIEDNSGRTGYLVVRTSPILQLLMGVIGALLGLFRGKRLEVISDGASWIGD